MGCQCPSNTSCYCNHYGCLSFIGDVIMVFLTAGLWLIWIFVREMRRNRR